MKVFGIAGWSGSGKTTLLIRLIPALVGRGVRLATVKHTHHDPAVGDEECRALARAGAVECVVASPRRFALVHEIHPGEEEPPLDWLVARFAGCDLLLIEGYKWASHAKLEVWDPGLGKSMLAPEEATVVALAADDPVAFGALPRFNRDDVAGIADFICQYCQI
ncbi:Molybdopterin-guanine dinucleotide biosynthesis protein MobB [Paramagnetospirillum magnetotacticum MS-1]|uniref:Molybdopterin-guanine dinucleotide biosynthesis protein MobB n=1 Tax=Paramagnetospirillum magnetotacticum MS-1 TaxID=272627 RepID=A0A0C2UZV3_PARME|nr:molybdopterin-guanine dinucleotide biosynthesis protein B [Paramagnetospirillum magnetotacticum]KIL98361.1 Molybdopterin-guanine dinucleotide biosynthesis protein MobB [Paramagnetospirillum magnetotacticum MS-1]